jgi:hypothetical protein
LALSDLMDSPDSAGEVGRSEHGGGEGERRGSCPRHGSPFQLSTQTQKRGPASQRMQRVRANKHSQKVIILLKPPKVVQSHTIRLFANWQFQTIIRTLVEVSDEYFKTAGGALGFVPEEALGAFESFDSIYSVNASPIAESNNLMVPCTQPPF